MAGTGAGSTGTSVTGTGAGSTGTAWCDWYWCR